MGRQTASWERADPAHPLDLAAICHLDTQIFKTKPVCVRLAADRHKRDITAHFGFFAGFGELERGAGRQLSSFVLPDVLARSP